MQELAELGPRGTLFRVGWELRGRTGLTMTVKGAAPPETGGGWAPRAPLAGPRALGRAVRPRVPPPHLPRLRARRPPPPPGRPPRLGGGGGPLRQPAWWRRR